MFQLLSLLSFLFFELPHQLQVASIQVLHLGFGSLFTLLVLVPQKKASKESLSLHFLSNVNFFVQLCEKSLLFPHSLVSSSGFGNFKELGNRFLFQALLWMVSFFENCFLGALCIHYVLNLYCLKLLFLIIGFKSRFQLFKFFTFSKLIFIQIQIILS